LQIEEETPIKPLQINERTGNMRLLGEMENIET